MLVDVKSSEASKTSPLFPGEPCSLHYVPLKFKETQKMRKFRFNAKYDSNIYSSRKIECQTAFVTVLGNHELSANMGVEPLRQHHQQQQLMFCSVLCTCWSLVSSKTETEL